MGDSPNLPAVGVDLGMGIALAFGGKDLMVKFLGPTAEYFGGELRQYSQKGFENLKRVIKSAVAKVGDGIEGPGAVPPRVLHRVLEDGFFCEDELAAEYLGGVLASSRVSDSRDDRAASWVNVLSRLTSYQVRAHYIIYMSVRACVQAEPEADRSKTVSTIRNGLLTLLIQKKDFVDALELGHEDEMDMVSHIEYGLRREDLIGVFGVMPNRQHELRIDPTINGASLLLWANGLGKRRTDVAFYAENMPALVGIKVPDGRLVPKAGSPNPRWG